MIAVVLLLVLLLPRVPASAHGDRRDEFPGRSPRSLLLITLLLSRFFGAGIYIAAALGGLAAVIGFTLSDRPFWNAVGQFAWYPCSSFILVSIPLFLLMGEILLRAGLSERLFRALNVWLVGLPGGLLHTNIVASGVFSAVCGSKRRDRRHHRLRRAALFREDPLQPAHGARLARGGWRAREPRPAGASPSFSTA